MGTTLPAVVKSVLQYRNTSVHSAGRYSFTYIYSSGASRKRTIITVIASKHFHCLARESVPTRLFPRYFRSESAAFPSLFVRSGKISAKHCVYYATRRVRPAYKGSKLSSLNDINTETAIGEHNKKHTSFRVSFANGPSLYLPPTSVSVSTPFEADILTPLMAGLTSPVM